MERQQRLTVAVLLIVLLLTLCLFSPTIADTTTAKSTSSTDKSPSTSSSTPPSSSSSSAPTAASVSPSSSSAGGGSADAARQQRVDRKQKRQEASRKRSEQQTKRVSDKAKKLTKKYGEQRKRRQDKDSKRLSKQQKGRERAEAYWTARKAATQPDAIEKAASRLSKLAKLAAASPLVELKERQFEEYVVGSPRPYWLLVSLTALGSKYECKICGLVHDAFAAVAPLVVAYSAAITNASDSALSTAAYNTLLSYNGSVPAAQREQMQREHDERAKQQLPIYVVELDIENARNVFNVLQLTTAPVVFLLPPSFAPKAAQMANLLTGLSGRYKFVPQSLDISARTFVDFINGHVDGKLSMAPSSGSAGFEGLGGLVTWLQNKISGFQPVILIYFSIILASLLLYFLVSLVTFYFKQRSSRPSTDGEPSLDGKAVDDAHSSSLLSFFLPSSTVNRYNPSASSIASLNFYQLPRLLRTLPLIVAGITFYLFCVSGGMFTIIKDTDSGYTVSSTGRWEFRQWISNQYMDQTVVESTVLAALYLSLTALFVLLNSRTFYQPSPASSRLSASSIVGWLSSWLVSPLWIVLAGVFVYLQLVNVYSKKNNYNWGVNWRWLKQVDWQKAIPSPVFHRYLRMVWAEVLKRLI